MSLGAGGMGVVYEAFDRERSVPRRAQDPAHARARRRCSASRTSSARSRTSSTRTWSASASCSRRTAAGSSPWSSSTASTSSTTCGRDRGRTIDDRSRVGQEAAHDVPPHQAAAPAAGAERPDRSRRLGRRTAAGGHRRAAQPARPGRRPSTRPRCATRCAPARARGSPRCTPPARCTATSSRRTSSSPRAAASCCSTSAWSRDAASAATGADVASSAPPAYMAPEQAAAARSGPRPTGTRRRHALRGADRPAPFDGRALAGARRTSSARSPRRRHARRPGLPADLDALCVDLLGATRAARPTGARGAAPPRRRGGPDAAGPVGAAAPLRRAPPRAARARWTRPSTTPSPARRVGAVLVARRVGHGQERAGPALPRATSAATRRRRPRGRCYERESVPYKALDGVIDALSRYLAAAAAPARLHALLPARRRAARRRSSPCCAERRARRPTATPRPRRPANPRELRAPRRRRAARAAARIADRAGRSCSPSTTCSGATATASACSPICCAPGARRCSCSDHAHRHRGAPQLRRAPRQPLARHPPPGAAEDEAGVPATPCSCRAEVRVLEVRDLPAEESRELVRMLLRGSDMPESTATEALAAEAGGHPLFIDALVRYRLSRQGEASPARLDDILWARMERSALGPPPARARRRRRRPLALDAAAPCPPTPSSSIASSPRCGARASSAAPPAARAPSSRTTTACARRL